MNPSSDYDPKLDYDNLVMDRADYCEKKKIRTQAIDITTISEGDKLGYVTRYLRQVTLRYFVLPSRASSGERFLSLSLSDLVSDIDMQVARLIASTDLVAFRKGMATSNATTFASLPVAVLCAICVQLLIEHYKKGVCVTGRTLHAWYLTGGGRCAFPNELWITLRGQLLSILQERLPNDPVTLSACSPCSPTQLLAAWLSPPPLVDHVHCTKAQVLANWIADHPVRMLCDDFLFDDCSGSVLSAESKCDVLRNAFDASVDAVVNLTQFLSQSRWSEWHAINPLTTGEGWRALPLKADDLLKYLVESVPSHCLFEKLCGANGRILALVGMFRGLSQIFAEDTLRCEEHKEHTGQSKPGRQKRSRTQQGVSVCLTDAFRVLRYEVARCVLVGEAAFPFLTSMVECCEALWNTSSDIDPSEKNRVTFASLELSRSIVAGGTRTSNAQRCAVCGKNIRGSSLMEHMRLVHRKSILKSAVDSMAEVAQCSKAAVPYSVVNSGVAPSGLDVGELLRDVTLRKVTSNGSESEQRETKRICESSLPGTLRAMLLLVESCGTCLDVEPFAEMGSSEDAEWAQEIDEEIFKVLSSDDDEVEVYLYNDEQRKLKEKVLNSL